jgi:DNA-binding LacI/PurR family transcriptional regulator
VALAREWEWELLDLDLLDGVLPDADYHVLYMAFRERGGERGMTVHLHNYAAAMPEGEVPGKQCALKAEDIRRWLAGLPKPGVFTFNDKSAIQICRAALEKGLRVPEEVAVLGHGNSIRCELSPVALSSIDVGREEAALAAMRLLRRLMQGEPGPQAAVMIPPKGVGV